MTDSKTAVIDRIVDGTTAVLLVEEEGRVVEQFDLDVEAIPDEGRHEGAVFDVVLEDDDVGDLAYRPDEERDRRNAAQARFDRRSERLPDE